MTLAEVLGRDSENLVFAAAVDVGHRDSERAGAVCHEQHTRLLAHGTGGDAHHECLVSVLARLARGRCFSTLGGRSGA